MAIMTIRLIPDQNTGKKNIIVALRSDADALPQEHEQMHRALVDKLVHGGLLKASEVGQIVVEREAVKKAPAQLAEKDEREEQTARRQGE